MIFWSIDARVECTEQQLEATRGAPADLQRLEGSAGLPAPGLLEHVIHR